MLDNTGKWITQVLDQAGFTVHHSPLCNPWDIYFFYPCETMNNELYWVLEVKIKKKTYSGKKKKKIRTQV